MTSKKDSENRLYKNVERLELIAFVEFFRLLEQRFRSDMIKECSGGAPWANKFYRAINETLISASARVQGQRMYRGPLLQERVGRLRQILPHADEIIECLTGEKDRRRHNVTTISDGLSYYLWRNSSHDFSPDSALDSMLQLRKMIESSVHEMEAEIIATGADDKTQQYFDKGLLVSKTGPAQNPFKSVLFTELMSVWKEYTGEAPKFGVKAGTSTSSFANFFSECFGPAGPSARTISDLCLTLKKTPGRTSITRGHR